MVLYPNKLPESERVCSGICSFDNEQVDEAMKQPIKIVVAENRMVTL